MGSKRGLKGERTMMQPRRQQPRTTAVVLAVRLRGLVRASSSGGPSLSSILMQKMSGFPTFPGGGQTVFSKVQTTVPVFTCLYLSSCPNKIYLLRHARRPAIILATPSPSSLFTLVGEEIWDRERTLMHPLADTRHLSVHFCQLQAIDLYCHLEFSSSI